MKLPAHAWRTFWAYHAWAGVALGLVLHLMFVSGAVALFLEPLRVWEEPAQHRAATDTTAVSPQALLERGQAAVAELHLAAPPPRLWLGLPQRETGTARFQYWDAASRQWRIGWLDAETGAFVPEREMLATFLYHLHYLWHPSLPQLEYLAGLLAVGFLLAVVTGVLIHLKDLARQLFQFRPRAGRRVLASDLHKVLGVMGLPFQVLFCYSGALLALGPALMTAMSGPVFGDDRALAGRVVWNEPAVLYQPAAAAAALAAPAGTGPRSLDDVLAIARTAVPGLQALSFTVQDHGKPRGFVRVNGTIEGDGPLRYGNVLIAERSGAVLQVDASSTDLASHSARRWVSGLHYVYYGGPAMRAILALLALAGAATILTGNWIWLARRRARGAGAREHVLARLTAGVGAGTFVAIACMFVASRVLPFTWAARATAEQLVFAGALLGSVAWALIARSASATWWRMLGLAGVLLLSVPLWAARVSSAGLFGSGPARATVRAVDLGLLASGALLVAAAWIVRRLLLRAARGGAVAPESDAGVHDDAASDEVGTDPSGGALSRGADAELPQGEVA